MGRPNQGILSLIAILLMFGGTVLGQDNSVDPERYRAALEKLKAKQIATSKPAKGPATTPATAPATAPATRSPQEEPVDQAASPATIFLVRFSGAMMNLADAARAQLSRAVRDLPDKARFNVIAYQGDAVTSLFVMPQPATGESRKKAYEYLDKLSPHGSGSTEQAIREAFKQNPDHIILIESGFDEYHVRDVPSMVKSLNKAKRVRFSCVALGDRSGDVMVDQRAINLMRITATANGGVCVNGDGKAYEPLKEEVKPSPVPPPAPFPDDRPGIIPK